MEGKSRADMARYLKVARGSVNEWVKNYLDNGTVGLVDVVQNGLPSQLSKDQLKHLKQFIENSSTSDKGGRLQAKDVHLFIVDHFEIDYKPSNIYRLLHHLNFSWITSRSRHPKYNEEAQTFLDPSVLVMVKLRQS